MEERKIPRVLLAAPSSMSGKTLITCALLDALKKQGRDPVSFKCGPDYIDPMFHSRVLGVEGRNLDSYFSDAPALRRSVAESGGGCAVLEGVMGLYDGAEVQSIRGSSYEIAGFTDTPVVLIVDAAGAGRTLIPVIKGILAEDRDGRIKGLILNRISEGFFASLKSVLEQELLKAGFGAELLGFVPKLREIDLRSRHLGLILPDEVEDLHLQIEKVSKALCGHVDPERLIRIMESAPELRFPEEEKTAAPERPALPERPAAEGLTLAVARDEAFCFYYRDNLELFERKGVRLCFFSPLKDGAVPAEASGLLLGGGYPELFLKELSRNTAMLSSLRRAVRGGMPSLAECGGFLYLHNGITDEKGNRYELAGLVDGDCFYAGHPVRFGYLELGEASDPKDPYHTFTGLRGHEFHYYESTCPGDAFTAKKPFHKEKRFCMVSENNGLWGFPHLYYGSAETAIDSFIEKMRKYRYG